MAAPVFMPVCGRRRDGRAPQRRRVEKSARRDMVEDILLDADPREADLSAGQPARQQQMAGLQAEKGDGFARLDALRADRAIGPVKAGGHVHRDDRRSAALIRATRSSAAPSSGRDRPAPNRASMTRPASRGSSFFAEVTSPPANPRRPGRRRRASFCGSPSPRQGTVKPLFAQDAGRDIAVAAIIARPAIDCDLPAVSHGRRNARPPPWRHSSRRAASANSPASRLKSSKRRPAPISSGVRSSTEIFAQGRA